MRIFNRSASYEYELLEKFEFGLVLLGCEVKSLRKGAARIQDAYLRYNGKHLLIYNMHIAQQAYCLEKPDVLRERIILCKKRELKKLIGAMQEKRQTVVPLELFWNKKGWAKIVCALAVGKTKYDKRQSIKEKEWKRSKEAAMKFK